MQLYHPHRKTARRDLQGLFLQLYPFNRPRNQTDTSGYNAVCATLEHIHAPGRHSAYTRYQRHDERHTGQHSRPIIIMYIRGQRCALVMYPCQTVQHTADHASPAGSAPTVCRSLASAAPGVPAEGSAPPPVQGQPGGLRSGTGSACRPPPGRAVQQQGRGGRRGTIDGYRRISFRAFAR